MGRHEMQGGERLLSFAGSASCFRCGALFPRQSPAPAVASPGRNLQRRPRRLLEAHAAADRPRSTPPRDEHVQKTSDGGGGKRRQVRLIHYCISWAGAWCTMEVTTIVCAGPLLTTSAMQSSRSSGKRPLLCTEQAEENALKHGADAAAHPFRMRRRNPRPPA